MKVFLIKFMDLFVKPDGKLTTIPIMAQRYENEADAKGAAANIKYNEKYITIVEREFKSGKLSS